MYIHMLFQYQEHLTKLLKEIGALAKTFEKYSLIQSVSDIRDKIAATIISEIGDSNQFENPKKLVACAGLDPPVFDQGNLKLPFNAIRKKVSQRLCKPLNRPWHAG